MKRLIVSCGGTGGHFNPGLSVARAFRDAGIAMAVRTAAAISAKNAPRLSVRTSRKPIAARPTHVRTRRESFGGETRSFPKRHSAASARGSVAASQPANVFATLKFPKTRRSSARLRSVP